MSRFNLLQPAHKVCGPQTTINTTEAMDNIRKNSTNPSIECLSDHQHPINSSSLEETPGKFGHTPVHCVDPVGSLSEKRSEQLKQVIALQQEQKQASAEHRARIVKITEPRKPVSSCLPSNQGKSFQKLATANTRLEQAEDNYRTHLKALGYDDPDKLENTAFYTDKQVSVAGSTFPEEGFFAFGGELRAQLETSSKLEFLKGLQSATTEDPFAVMKADFGRSKYTIATQGEAPELLYDEDSSVAQKDHSIVKFQDFVGDNQPLQIAIASLMSQQGMADFERIKANFSAGQTPGGESLSPFFRQGLIDVMPLELTTRPSSHGKTTSEICYSLEKIATTASVPEKFQLTSTAVSNEQRIDPDNSQEFTLHQIKLLCYTFEVNPAFQQGEEVSLENLPIILKCSKGQLSHCIELFDGTRPEPVDHASLDTFHHLTEDQKTAVTNYQKAQENHKTAEQGYHQKINQLAGRSSLHTIPGLAASSKAQAERVLQQADNRLELASRALKKDPLTASFLEENTIFHSRENASSVRDEISTTISQSPSFVGGKKLQQEVTAKMKHLLVPFFNGGHKAAYQALEESLSTTTHDSYLSFMLEAPDQQPAELSANNPDRSNPIDKLTAFVGNDYMAQAIASMMTPQIVSIASDIVRPLSNESMSSETLSETPHNHHISFHVQKIIPAIEENPYFVLTIEDSLTLAEKRKKAATFVYTLRKNPFYDFSELATQQNLPIDVRCARLSIARKI